MKVSVCMITYNHEEFIEQAIKGVLDQKTDFDFDLVIGEDYSTDKTRQIILDYKAKYPEKIKLLLHDSNIGMMPNFQATLHACQGEYIAICEGDDYWTDPHKLQKQVELLKLNSKASICFHPVNLVDAGGSFISESKIFELKDEYTTLDLLNQEWFVMTCSIMFRKNYLTIPSWFVSIKNGDYALQLICSLKGDLIYLNHVMGAYRVHSSGVSQSLQLEKNFYALLILFKFFNKYSDYKFKNVIENRKSRMRTWLINYYVYETLKHKYLSVGYLKNYRKLFSMTKILNFNHLKSILHLSIPPKIYKLYKSNN